MHPPTDSSLALLVIGDEVLSHAVRETNIDYTLQTAAAAGCRVAEVRIVADQVPSIARAVQQLAGEGWWIITSGGVGPTHDDVTMQAVAEAYEVPLVEHPRMLEFLQRAYGKRLSPVVRRMSLVPEGTVVEVDHDRHWPLLHCRGCYILPGLPRAYRNRIDMIFAALPPQPPVAVAAVYTDSDETVFAEQLGQLQQRHPLVEIGSYPQIPGEAGYAAKVTVRSRDADAVRQAFAELQELFSSGGWLKRSEPV